jgi:hypothetical protein
MKGWSQIITSTSPTLGWFWSLHDRRLYSAKDGSSQITDQTNRSSTQTKPQTVFQHLYILPNTYYERMEPANYVCWPIIRLVLVIT